MSNRADSTADSSRAARADIEATRARMGDTLEELGVRLNPGRLKQQAKDTVRDATIGRVQTMAQTTKDKAANAGRKLTDTVRENPIPAALIAAGISWLAFSARKSGSSNLPVPVSDYESIRSATYDVSGESRGSYSTAEDSAITDNARDKATPADHAKEMAANVASTAQAQTDKVADTFQENPLPLGLVVAALGLAAGFALPVSRKERELVGEKRDEIIDKARDLVREKKEQAQHVAERVVNEAKSTATQAAREEGLTSAT
jgi:hypothetical protein